MESVIHVRHEEANIRATMVLLKCQYEAGEIRCPFNIAIPESAKEDAWRAAAINYLNGKTPRKVEEVLKAKQEQKWLEENDRLDWEEERERRR